MSKRSLFSFLSTAALTFVLVGQAGATTVTMGGTSVANEGIESSVAGATTITFDGLTVLPSRFTASGTTPANPLVSGTSSNLYAPPANDTSTYLTTGTGTITYTPTRGLLYLGFYWGSVDYYNTLTLTDSLGVTTTYTGSTIGTLLGIPSNGSVSAFVNFTPTAGATFTTATFTSSQYSFEFDNLAVIGTPEPGTVAMLAGGLLVIGGMLRRRKA